MKVEMSGISISILNIHVCSLQYSTYSQIFVVYLLRRILDNSYQLKIRYLTSEQNPIIAIDMGSQQPFQTPTHVWEFQQSVDNNCSGIPPIRLASTIQLTKSCNG